MSQSIEAFKNAFKIPELKQRIIFTLIMLAVYRLGAHVATPGVNGRALAELMSGKGGLMSFYDMFTGGAFRKATVFALGIMPYISASIILQLLTAVIPALEKLAKEGAQGQKKITQYTRYGTIVLCIIQSLGLAIYLKNLSVRAGTPIVAPDAGLGYYLMCILSFTTGTAFIMWLGEQISEYGVGNGISLIIFTGIVARFPQAMMRLISYVRSGEVDVFRAGMLILLLAAVVAGAIYLTLGQRRVAVQYPRQVKGRKSYGGTRSYLPLRVNQAGVIPIIFAGSILMLPVMLGNAITVSWFSTLLDYFRNDGWVYNISYAILIIFFCFFYTAITFNPIEIADNMKKYGGVVMGVRPGKATAEYLERVMNRITVFGSLALATVALFPRLVFYFFGIQDWQIASFFGGTSLLILVGVALDTVRQIEQHLTMRNYEGFMKGGRMKSRRF